MCAMTVSVKLLVIYQILQPALLIITSTPATAPLWHLTNFALEQGAGRQTGGHGGHGNAGGFRLSHFPVAVNAPANFPAHHQFGHAGGFNQQQATAAITDVLHSIASNDELRCVPKLLCELTSGSRAAATSSSPLPFNVNMGSLLAQISALRLPTHPLFHFGHAALLGYTSRGSECADAFPRCPNDPNQLVNYLNNHNGGFFRFFNGAGQLGHQPYQQYQQFLFDRQRILAPSSIRLQYNKMRPDGYAESNSIDQDNNFKASAIKFPVDGGHKSAPRAPKSLAFPDDTASGYGMLALPLRSESDATFPMDVDFPRPPPTHVASPLIFPTRTGTGEFLLDVEEHNKF